MAKNTGRGSRVAMFGGRKPIPVSAETGLPELPEGYYWSIGEREGQTSSWDDVWDCYGICIRTGPRKKDRSYRSDEIKGNVETTIHHKASQLAERFYRDRQNRADRAMFAGEYPPRRMP